MRLNGLEEVKELKVMDELNVNDELLTEALEEQDKLAGFLDGLDLKRPGIKERIRLNDITKLVMGKDGKMYFEDSFRAVCEWASIGLFDKPFDDLNDEQLDDFEIYSDAQLKAISVRVREMAGNPSNG